MLSQVAFVRKSDYERDSDEEPKRDKKHSKDKKDKQSDKGKKKKHRHKVLSALLCMADPSAGHMCQHGHLHAGAQQAAGGDMSLQHTPWHFSSPTNIIIPESDCRASPKGSTPLLSLGQTRMNHRRSPPAQRPAESCRQCAYPMSRAAEPSSRRHRRRRLQSPPLPRCKAMSSTPCWAPPRRGIGPAAKATRSQRRRRRRL